MHITPNTAGYIAVVFDDGDAEKFGASFEANNLRVPPEVFDFMAGVFRKLMDVIADIHNEAGMRETAELAAELASMVIVGRARLGPIENPDDAIRSEAEDFAKIFDSLMEQALKFKRFSVDNDRRDRAKNASSGQPSIGYNSEDVGLPPQDVPDSFMDFLKNLKTDGL